MAPRSGGQIVVDQLRELGAEHVFCVPGESFLPILDALHDAPDLTLVVCRHEGGAAYMADAYGKLTGRPAVLLVSRGPGATNAAIGLHTARQDSTPLIALVGQAERAVRDREAFQEIDYTPLLGPVTKWRAEVSDPARLPEYLSRAFHMTMAGRPGPVALALPEDVLFATADVSDVPRIAPARSHPGPADLQKVKSLLAAAERPLVVVGGGGWSAAAGAAAQAFCEAWRIPVGAAFRCQDYVPNDSPSYCGPIGIGVAPALARRVRDADVLLAVGTRLDEATTSGYTLVEAPAPRQTLIHVQAGPDEIGRVYAPAIGITAGSQEFFEAMGLRPAADPAQVRAEWTQQARADYLADRSPAEQPGSAGLGAAIADLCAQLPADTIVTNGAGNYTAWCHRFWSFTQYRSQLGPANGSMGYGVPAAVAAKLTCPDRAVVAFSGDGCFLMNGQELATAVAHRLSIAFVVINNGMYGTIRMHQERHYPGRVAGTNLTNPDFAAYGRAFGAEAEVIGDAGELAGAVVRAVKREGPTVIELRTPSATLAMVRS
jgi:acetolactate synthase I/II/III large subunit